MGNTKKSILILALVSLSFLSLVITAAFGADPAIWRGNISISNSSGSNLTAEQGAVVDAFTSAGVWLINATAKELSSYPDGFYFVVIQGNPGDNIYLQVWGVNASGTQSWSIGLHDLNLTMVAAANSAACSYSKGCNGGYCCSGATTINGHDSSGTCQATACSSSSSSSSTSTGGGSSSSSSSSSSTSSSTGSSGGTGDTAGNIASGLQGSGGTVGVVVASSAAGSFNSGETAKIELTKPEDTGLAAVEITVANTVSAPKVTVTTTTLTSSQTPAVSSTSSAAIFQYVDIVKANFQNTDVKDAKVKLQVPVKWVSDNKIDPSSVSLTKMVDNKWVKQPTAYLKKDDKFYYYEASVTGFSLFAITGQKKLDAFQVIDAINAFYGGKSSYSAFDIIDIIKSFYATS